MMLSYNWCWLTYVFIRCDRTWFARTFCAGAQANNEEEVWAAVDSVNLYSPIALLAALPGSTLKNYFKTMHFTVRSATHHVIGLTEEVPPRNVINPGELRSLVIQSLLSAGKLNVGITETSLIYSKRSLICVYLFSPR
jgi:hypothetical protein